MHTLRLLIPIALALTSCSNMRETVSDTVRTATRDTVRLVTERRDTVRTSDTVRLFVRERGDTVVVFRDAVRWRGHVVERRDTVLRIRRDTLWRTKTERVEVKQPLRMSDWLWPLVTGAVAGALSMLWLTRRS